MTFTPSNPQIMIRLSAGGNEEYQRDWNDPDRGAVRNVETLNRAMTKVVAGGMTDAHPQWFDLTPSQLAACKEIALELGTVKVVVIRKVGSFRTAFIAQTYKFGESGRYYVCETEIGE